MTTPCPEIRDATQRTRRCLFITANMLPLRNFRGGGPSVAWAHLRALREMGLEVDLFSYFYPDAWRQFEPWLKPSSDFDALRDMCTNIMIKQASGQPSFFQRVAIRQPDYHRCRIIDGSLLKEVIPSLRQLQGQARPDLIWAEHVSPLRLALLVRAEGQCVVYSHHDFPERVKALGANRPVDDAKVQATADLVSMATVAISPSSTEGDELKRRGCENVHYCPAAVETGDGPPSPAPATGWSPRLVHLGGMRTTASREGLRLFMERAWPKLKWSLPELVIIGDLDGMDLALAKLISGATRLGYVENLVTALTPFDIHLIPWPFDTGVRTRLAAAFSRFQVVVATRAAVSGSPEVVDGKNCVLAGTVDEMAEMLNDLKQDHARLTAIGRAAHATYQEHMSTAATTRHLRIALSACLGPEDSW